MFENQSYALYVGKKSLTFSDLSTHEYAEAVELYSILCQITKIYLRKNSLHPQNMVQEYLSQCNKGQHVLLKSFNSFNKSTMNKMCFLQNFIKIFELENHQRNALDYYQLFRLLCSDFPKDIVLKSANLINQNKQDMTKILNSRKYINALYINFIHTEYLDSLFNEVFEGNGQNSNRVPITLLSQWVFQKQKNMHKVYEKPLFSSVVQAILNLIRKKGLITGLKKKVTFLNDKNYLQFVRTYCGPAKRDSEISKKIKKQKEYDQQGNMVESMSEFEEPSLNKQYKGNSQQSINNTIGYQEFLKEIINQVDYNRWIKDNLQMFENSIIWAVQTYKILSVKETVDPQPINQKKMKNKNR